LVAVYLLYLMACLMSPAPLINLAESRVSLLFQNYGNPMTACLDA
jgi:hypothetical protein